MQVSVSGALPGQPVRVVIGEDEFRPLADAAGVAVVAGARPLVNGAVSVTASDAAGAEVSATLRVLPGWVSVLPPLLAILIAFLLRNVIPALLIGIWVGAAALRSFSPQGIFGGLLDSFQVFVVGSVTCPSKLLVRALPKDELPSRSQVNHSGADTSRALPAGA
jgi:hypothetical protein